MPLLKRKHVLRIFDIFTLEGYHSIFRIGTTLLCLAHAHLGDSCREHCDNAAIFWEGVRLYWEVRVSIVHLYEFVCSI